MIEEYFDILDEYGQRVGQVCPRSIVHEQGYFHASVHVWIVNSKKGIMLQKRSLLKDTHPGLWDISCAGHLSAGDTPLDAAVRECYEELGLNIKSSELLFLFKIYQSYTSPDCKIKDNEFASVYLFSTECDFQIIICPEEVDQVKFVNLDSFKQMVENSDQQLVPHKEEYRKVIDVFNSISLLKHPQ